MALAAATPGAVLPAAAVRAAAADARHAGFDAGFDAGLGAAAMRAVAAGSSGCFATDATPTVATADAVAAAAAVHGRRAARAVDVRRAAAAAMAAAATTPARAAGAVAALPARHVRQLGGRVRRFARLEAPARAYICSERTRVYLGRHGRGKPRKVRVPLRPRAVPQPPLLRECAAQGAAQPRRRVFLERKELRRLNTYLDEAHV
mmetsp:Transcript_10745/g.35740  ORF Transcript_10745/g.35740 Transcript_10745/m.35740 type:complete len:205 (-) Transcript_10745:87-701(-)